MLVFNCVRTTLKQKFTWYVFILEQRQTIRQVKNDLDIYQSLLTLGECVSCVCGLCKHHSQAVVQVPVPG